MLKEHDRIVLIQDLPNEGLPAGGIGTIVRVHRNGEAFEVEFLTRDGDTEAVATVLASQIRPANDGVIPYVIDNQLHRLADVLNEILAQHADKSLDIATAYFNVQGFRLLQEGLEKLGSFRLLLGDEPREGAAVGLRPRAASQLVTELNKAPFDEDTLRAVEDLIAFLRRELVHVRAYQRGFLHAKSYLFYRDLPTGGADRFQPVAAIVGSSNFTGPGLTTNKELNLSHKTVLSEEEVLKPGPPPVDGPQELAFRQQLMSSVGAEAITELDRWFQRQWDTSRDFKDELIELLDASKFGQKEYTPYQVYMKALFEYFKDDLDGDLPTR